MQSRHPWTLEEKKGIAKAHDQIDLLGRPVCYIDRESFESFEDMHVEHLRPISKGGTDRIGNTVLMCPKHNLRKGTKLLRVTRKVRDPPHTYSGARDLFRPRY